MSETISYPNDGLRRLVEGYRQFYQGNPARKGFCAFQAEQIADKQHPHSMVISCFDSRVCPEAIFGTNDGHICVHRNMLNQVDLQDTSMMASLRFAVDVLKVQNVVILGHSDCNAVQKLLYLDKIQPEVRSWLAGTGARYRGETVDEAVKNNVTDQLERLQKIPFVEQAVRDGALNLEGMFFHIYDGLMERYDAQKGVWNVIPTEA